MPVQTATASRPRTANPCGYRPAASSCWAATRDPTLNGGVGIAYQYANFTLGNADDEIILLDGSGTEIDRVAYDGGPAFPNPDGASMNLIRPDLDNALGANWRISPNPWPGSAGDRGSPGAANPLILPASTATPTATPTATATPTVAATPTETPSPTSTATWTPTTDANNHTNANGDPDTNTVGQRPARPTQAKSSSTRSCRTPLRFPTLRASGSRSTTQPDTPLT